MAARATVDVVVPFIGSDHDLHQLCERLAQLRMQHGDSATVVDNRPSRAPQPERSIFGVRVVGAPTRQTSYHARNRGAAAGTATWLLFVDADVLVPPDLIDRYFDPRPDVGTGVLAGEIVDEAPTGEANVPVAVRYAHLASVFARENTLSNDDFGYAMTANCAIRRTAFEAVGGFIDNIRSGGDADIGIKLRRAGWAMERRDHATVTHVNRDSVRKLVRQSVRFGSGSAWLHRAYPGFSPPSRIPGAWGSRRLVAAVAARVRGDRDRALVAFIDGVRSLAFEVGRRLPNEVDAS